MNLTEKILRILQPKERILKTIWRAEKDGTVNYLIGTAHFFPYHFRISLKKLFRKTKRALFEGPLDSSSMEQVVVQGAGGKGSLEIYEALDPETIQEIKREDRRPLRRFQPVSPLSPPACEISPTPCGIILSKLSPWLAFFQHLDILFENERLGGVRGSGGL